MLLQYNCLICYKYCEVSLSIVKKQELFLCFDDDREHRLICVECKTILKNKIISECFINPIDRLNNAYSLKPNPFIIELRKQKSGLTQWLY